MTGEFNILTKLSDIEIENFAASNEIGKKIRPSQEEIEKNPRARSAIMRVFEKV